MRAGPGGQERASSLGRHLGVLVTREALDPIGEQVHMGSVAHPPLPPQSNFHHVGALDARGCAGGYGLAGVPGRPEAG